jgi:hypothetical protein
LATSEQRLRAPASRAFCAPTIAFGAVVAMYARDQHAIDAARI